MFSLLVSCDEPKSSYSALSERPEDPIVAVFAVEDGKGCIRAGKLRSGHFKKLCDGDYPSLSPSGKFLAYNQSTRNGIQAVRVIEIRTGKVTIFDSIPKDIAPWPESFWSKDEKLIAFHVHDFTGNRSRCVVSMEDGSFWRGTDLEFRDKHPDDFGVTTLGARASVEGRLEIRNLKHVGALFFRSGGGESIRLTPENMGVTGTPIWIEKTGEALFVGSRVNSPYGDEDVLPGKIYLIRPGSMDWANASEKEWEKAVIMSGEQVSLSR